MTNEHKSHVQKQTATLCNFLPWNNCTGSSNRVIGVSVSAAPPRCHLFVLSFHQGGTTADVKQQTIINSEILDLTHNEDRQED